MCTSVEHSDIIAASSTMEEDGVTNEQPITGLGALQVGERLFCVEGWKLVGRSLSGTAASRIDLAKLHRRTVS